MTFFSYLRRATGSGADAVTEAISPVVKQPGYKADHSTPTGIDKKQMRIYTSTPSYVLMTYCFVS
jgi:hypothetical protein